MKAPALLLSSAALVLAPQAAAQVEVGDQPQYTFRSPLQNGMGVTELADLRGKPVLVEFWGIN